MLQSRSPLPSNLVIDLWEFQGRWDSGSSAAIHKGMFSQYRETQQNAVLDTYFSSLFCFISVIEGKGINRALEGRGKIYLEPPCLSGIYLII